MGKASGLLGQAAKRIAYSRNGFRHSASLSEDSAGLDYRLTVNLLAYQVI